MIDEVRQHTDVSLVHKKPETYRKTKANTQNKTTIYYFLNQKPDKWQANIISTPVYLQSLNLQNGFLSFKLCLHASLSSFFLNEILDLYTSFSTFAIENGLKLSF